LHHSAFSGTVWPEEGECTTSLYLKGYVAESFKLLPPLFPALPEEPNKTPFETIDPIMFENEALRNVLR